MKLAGKYTADFVYYDQTKQGGWVIEDFKPTFVNPKTKKVYPKIEPDTKLRLNWLHAQLNGSFDVYASYEDSSQIGGYGMKQIIPNKINASEDHVHI